MAGVIAVGGWWREQRGLFDEHPLIVDALIALVVLTATIGPLITALDSCDCPRPGALAYLLVIAESLPLVWRRRAPFLTAAVVGAATAIHGAAAIPEPPVPFGALIGIYTAAAYAAAPLAVLAGVIALAAVTVVGLLPRADYDALDWGFNYVITGAAWVLGDLARTRRAYTAELLARAERAEADRLAEARRAVAEERARVARELHDVVAHHVSMMVVQAEAGPVVAGDPARATQVFDTISDTGRAALTEMRRLLGVLRDDDAQTGGPADRAPQPGLDALARLVTQVRDAGLDVELRVDGEPRPLPPGLDLTAYRVVQEALTNARKHAGPARVVVAVRYGGALELEVTDDGLGAVPGGADGGHGLVGMRERIAVFGGRLEAGPLAGGGWRVCAALPLDDPVDGPRAGARQHGRRRQPA